MRLSCVGAAAIVLLVLVAIASRLTKAPQLWPYDIANAALAYVFFLALAPALESGHHVVADIFEALVPRALRSHTRSIAAIVTIVFGTVLFWQLWRHMGRAFADNRVAAASVPIPLKWIYLIGPIGAALFIFTAICEFLRSINLLSEVSRSAPNSDASAH